MRIIKQLTLNDFFKETYGLPLAQKIKLLWRKGWTEIPDVMASSGCAILGLGVGAYVLNRLTEVGPRKKYFYEPRIYRPDDPRIQYISPTSGLD